MAHVMNLNVKFQLLLQLDPIYPRKTNLFLPEKRFFNLGIVMYTLDTNLKLK